MHDSASEIDGSSAGQYGADHVVKGRLVVSSF